MSVFERGSIMRKLAIMLTEAAVVLVSSGCDKKDASGLPDSSIQVDSATPSWQKDKGTADLSWYINFDWFAQVWGKDVATKYITEDTNVNITYQNGTDDKLNTMMASGD